MGAESEAYCEIYRELAELVGEGGARKIWQQYAGLSVNFPIRLYSREYTLRFVAEQYKKMKAAEIAKALSLSERRVRQIIYKLRLNASGE